MNLGLDTREQLQIDKNKLKKWRKAMDYEFDEREIWQDEDKVNWAKPVLTSIAIAIPLFLVIGILWLALS